MPQPFPGSENVSVENLNADVAAAGGLFVAGGIAGGLIGTRLARLLPARRGALNIVFAAVIIAVALYTLARNLSLS